MENAKKKWNHKFSYFSDWKICYVQAATIGMAIAKQTMGVSYESTTLYTSCAKFIVRDNPYIEHLSQMSKAKHLVRLLVGI